MNQKELVKAISEKIESTEKEALEFLEAFYEVIAKNIDGEIKLAGLGTFSSTERKARKGRNPKTGEEIDIAAKWVPVFKASSKLKDSVQKMHS